MRPRRALFTGATLGFFVVPGDEGFMLPVTAVVRWVVVVVRSARSSQLGAVQGFFLIFWSIRLASSEKCLVAEARIKLPVTQASYSQSFMPMQRLEMLRGKTRVVGGFSMGENVIFW